METWKVRTEINDVGAPNRVFEEHWLVFGDKWLMPHDDDEWTKEELEAIAKKLNDQGETAERLEQAEKDLEELEKERSEWEAQCVQSGGELDEAQKKLEQAEKEIEELREVLKYIRQAYGYEMLLADMQKIDAVLAEQTKP